MTPAPATQATRYQRTYPGHPAQVAQVRRDLTRHLEGCPAADDAVLIASELAANAILHGRSAGHSFTIRCHTSPRQLRIEVQDAGGPWRPRSHGDRPHGLDIVQALTGPDGWEPSPSAPGDASCGRSCHGDRATARARRQAPGRPVRDRRREHPCPSAAPRLDPGPPRPADGLARSLHRLRRRRPPRRPAAPLRPLGDRPARRHLRRPRRAAAHLRQPAATCGSQPPPGYACLACGAEHLPAPAHPAGQ